AAVLITTVASTTARKYRTRFSWRPAGPTLPDSTHFRLGSWTYRKDVGFPDAFVKSIASVQDQTTGFPGTHPDCWTEGLSPAFVNSGRIYSPETALRDGKLDAPLARLSTCSALA